MILEGVITNVAAFGAFVDIGVHQDGLVHISALSNSFVKDPHTIVKTGQVVKVKVLEVDEKRKRIALTMRLTDVAPQPNGKPEQRTHRDSKIASSIQRAQQETSNVRLHLPHQKRWQLLSQKLKRNRLDVNLIDAQNMQRLRFSRIKW